MPPNRCSIVIVSLCGPFLVVACGHSQEPDIFHLISTESNSTDGGVKAAPNHTHANSPSSTQKAPVYIQKPISVPGQPTSVPVQVANNRCVVQSGQQQTLGIETCYCEPHDTQTGSVWGDGMYTGDSNPCRAAVHAGLIDNNGGMISFERTSGCGYYPGTLRFGVQSASWNAWGASFFFTNGPIAQCATPPVQQPRNPNACPPNFEQFTRSNSPLSCVCTNAEMTGAVWGDHPYTTDSSICLAAVHSGVIPPSGGAVTVMGAPGCPGYPGTSRNGVGSAKWGQYANSFYFSQLGKPACKHPLFRVVVFEALTRGRSSNRVVRKMAGMARR